jgi:hypothetical protein
MKTYWRSEGIAPRIHDPSTRWEVSGQLPAPVALPPSERPPGTHLTGGWVGPRAGIDAVVKGKIPNPCRDSNSFHPARSPAL